ncbi:hypothetical protein LSTR_LSTR008461 [Laodelphax striatellus]|uniref:Uncharacterized protein n=1 Tax=Laodelphax striatellus TaxID=195883 RepID=A0A482XSS1_LAOST|nr:hypothetical protein LSTR_LSTR008461 [Laodelphax striatellus]
MSSCKKLKFDCTLSEQIAQQKIVKEPGSCGPKNILLVEASRRDRDTTDTNTALLERVWILSRPPINLKDPTPTVSARRLQVARAILDGDFQKDEGNRCPPAPPCPGGESESSARGSTSTRSLCA